MCSLGQDQASGEPPCLVPDGDCCWVRTSVKKGADLVDGSAWIGAFEQRLKHAHQAVTAAPGRRLLRQTLSDGDSPHFWGGAADSTPNHVRNHILKAMFDECGTGPARREKLLTGHDVLFWFNVGPPGPPRERVYVTDAFCPHQGVCLISGELKDVEDLASNSKRGMIRCPRHNKTFDLRSGESPGNSELLRVYPCRFENGHWYVGVAASEAMPTLEMLARTEGTAAMESGDSGQADMVVDEPDQKKQRLNDLGTPTTPLRNELRAPRALVQHATMG